MSAKLSLQSVVASISRPEASLASTPATSSPVNTSSSATTSALWPTTISLQQRRASSGFSASRVAEGSGVPVARWNATLRRASGDTAASMLASVVEQPERAGPDSSTRPAGRSSTPRTHARSTGSKPSPSSGGTAPAASRMPSVMASPASPPNSETSSSTFWSPSGHTARPCACICSPS